MSKVVVKGQSLEQIAETVTSEIRQEMGHRAYLAANELRNSALMVLRGQRHGRRYKVPGTYGKHKDKVTGKVKNGRYYTASAPGEPPAVRTGTFRNSWQPHAYSSHAFGISTYWSRIESDVRTDNGQHTLGKVLEEGTTRMAPRPHHDRILAHAEKKIFQIYDQPYFNE